MRPQQIRRSRLSNSAESANVDGFGANVKKYVNAEPKDLPRRSEKMPQASVRSLMQPLMKRSKFIFQLRLVQQLAWSLLPSHVLCLASEIVPPKQKQ
ncbi:hypothetical protein Nepgr_017232 [Nepenthes gracilis]|uniref:Uncharacterized protein n=1 Tax=Nepenthes gracilis TaxID=150966 RepID=A0AAD3XT43_NEPGR|nr:hypothetical protein Nepgr_017232 [Nepenthes gracilis]